MQTIIPFKLLSLRGDGFHLLIEVVINNKKVNMIIDTGASKTVFDKARLHLLLEQKEFKEHDHPATGLGTTEMKTYLVHLKKFRVGKMEVKNYLVGVLDLSHVNVSYERLGLKSIEGILGSDFLRKYKAVINYEKKTLTLKSKKKK